MQFHSQLDQYRFEKYVLEVAISTLENGGTVSKLDTYQLLPPTDDWKFPKYPSKTVILPPNINVAEELKRFIQVNDSFLREPDCFLGTWLNPKTSHFYFDVATCRIDFEEAKQLALELGEKEGRKIVALYNSKRNETYYLYE